MSGLTKRVAVIGAGIAGATCARFLADAGLEVGLFDKSRGAGGRMSARRAEWADEAGTLHPARFDHGAPGFLARSADFIRFTEDCARRGWVSRWAPLVHPTVDNEALWVPTPDQPTLCRALIEGLPLHTECLIDTLEHNTRGWALSRAGAPVAEGFDAVIVAIPPQQAAPLLRPHQPVWAEQAEHLTMLPGWVLMAVTADDEAAPAWDVARPGSGPLDYVIRNDRKPGRPRTPGHTQWVAHATPEWSQRHLEAPAAATTTALQHALAELLGRPLQWRHSAVHRWRYANAPACDPSFWWDADIGLGVCGDALGGSGVEGAWRSARALAAACLKHLTAAPLPESIDQTESPS